MLTGNFDIRVSVLYIQYIIMIRRRKKHASYLRVANYKIFHENKLYIEGKQHINRFSWGKCI